MLKRITFIALFTAGFAMSAPAFADGTGKGPTYNAPAPLTPQSYTTYNNHPTTYNHNTLCHSGCASSGPHYSNSGLPTNPRPTCHSGCNYTPPTATYIPPHTPVPVVHHPVVSTPQMRAGDVVSLDGATISSMNGGVGVGVNDVFVGGGFGSGGFVGSSFGTRASGAFAGRNVALSRSFSGSRRGFSGSRGGFRSGSRGGFRGGRRGGGGGGKR